MMRNRHLARVLARPLIAFGLLTLLSCGTTKRADLTTLNVGKFGNNWDEILIAKIDDHKIQPAQQSVKIAAGMRTVTFRISYMRGDLSQPIVAEVPVTAYFAPDCEYKAHVDYQTGLMGALIVTESSHAAGNNLTAGALVYSREFDEYGQRHETRKTSQP